MGAVNQAIVEAFALAERGTKARVATELGVAPATVSRWASGEVTPEQRRWADLEPLLGLPAGALMEAHRSGVTQPDAGEDIPPAVLDAIAELGGELRRLRSELAELRREVHGSARSSDPAPPTRSPTPEARP